MRGYKRSCNSDSVRRRAAATAIGAVFAVAFTAVAVTSPALAAPEWGITMTHANAYGLQAGECPGGKEAYFPGAPEKDCGVDPYTGSGTTFAQEAVAHLGELELSDVGRVERAERDPGIRVLSRIAYGLGVLPAELLHGVSWAPKTDPH